MNRWHMTLKWALRCSLIVIVGAGGSSFAQEAHPLQAAFQGPWTEDNESGDETMAQRRFISVAESNLSAAGEAFRAAYSDSTGGCPMAGALAGQAADFEFIDRGSVVELAAFGRTRRIHMDFFQDPPESFVPNPLGWSTGRWAGDMLVIRTRGLSEGVIKRGERPLPFGGPVSQIVERYTLSEDGNRLSVELNMIDTKFYGFSINVRHNYVRTNNIAWTQECELPPRAESS